MCKGNNRYICILQQIEGQDQKIVRDLKREVIRFVNEGNSLEIPENRHC